MKTIIAMEKSNISKMGMLWAEGHCCIDVGPHYSRRQLGMAAACIS